MTMNDPQVPSFSQPWKNSDAVLVVEGKELHVHTTILSLASPVFEKMFDGNFKESQTKRVELHEKSYELVEHILKIIYPNIAMSLDLNSNKMCGDCLPVEDMPSGNVSCEECRDNADMRPFCTLCIKSTIHYQTCIKCNNFFIFTGLQKKRRMEHLRQLYNFSQEFLMDALIRKISFETIRLSNELSPISDDMESTLELLVLSDSVKCKESMANCIRFISTKYHFHEQFDSNGNRNSLSGLLIQLNVRSEVRLKLMGLILRKHLKELMPYRNEKGSGSYQNVKRLGSYQNVKGLGSYQNVKGLGSYQIVKETNSFESFGVPVSCQKTKGELAYEDINYIANEMMKMT